MKLNPKAFGFASAIFSGGLWFLAMAISLLTGLGQTTLITLGGYHPFFSYNFAGLLIITVEHLICCFILGWIFAWLYNQLVKSETEQSQ